MEQKIQFTTTSDNVNISYATLGQGPPLVKAANWLSHLEFDWGSPVWRHWWTELAKHNTLVRRMRPGSLLSSTALTLQQAAANGMMFLVHDDEQAILFRSQGVTLLDYDDPTWQIGGR